MGRLLLNEQHLGGLVIFLFSQHFDQHVIQIIRHQ